MLMNIDRRQMMGTLGALALGACSKPSSETTTTTTTTPSATMKKEPFGKLPDGTPVELFTLTNANGVSSKIINYGGRVVTLNVPDKKGTMADVVFGFDNLDGYLAENPYFGALVGRYANRIGKAQFTLDGKVYKLAVNNGPNSLHGGKKGFDKVIWTAADVSTPAAPALELRYESKDGEEGYPGELLSIVTYTLTPLNELKIDYKATTNMKTVLNLTNHSYWNLAGAGSGDILGHKMMIAAGKFTPVDSTLIPTGELKSLDGSPFDFRTPTAIGERIDKDDQQLKFGKGYDHNYVIDAADGSLKQCALVTDPGSGRTMEVLTTQPGVQFYTGNFLDGTLKGKGGKVYGHRGAFCLETQHFPDTPNKPAFPTAELKPGEEYRHTTVYRFSAV
jgi:aldose 1-epimerase